MPEIAATSSRLHAKAQLCPHCRFPVLWLQGDDSSSLADAVDLAVVGDAQAIVEVVDHGCPGYRERQRAKSASQARPDATTSGGAWRAGEVHLGL